MEFFDIENIAFTIHGTGVSWLEFVGVIFGGAAVWLSGRASLWSWPIGIINVIFFFFLFFQAQLYPDMFLQVFFLVTNVIGWWRWSNPREGEEDKRLELKVSYMTRAQLITCALVAIAGTISFGLFASRLHEWFPVVFSLPSAVPFLDSFIAVFSILAQYYMMQKKIECWVLWCLVNILATYVYFIRDLWFTGGLYFVNFWLAVYGLWNWIGEYKSYDSRADNR